MICLIAAVAENMVIGKENCLPWNIPEDMKIFKQLTIGNSIVMGRKTYESIGKPLPNRKNIVVSRTMEDEEGVVVCRSLEEGIEEARKGPGDVFIIGGASIYGQAMPHAEVMYISHVKRKADGDVHFPEWEEDEWEVAQEKDYEEFTFREYRRKG